MIKMKRTYLLVLILFLSVSLSAQKDKQAREILDKTANALQQAGGIRATFGGTGNGTLLLILPRKSCKPSILMHCYPFTKADIIISIQGSKAVTANRGLK